MYSNPPCFKSKHTVNVCYSCFLVMTLINCTRVYQIFRGHSLFFVMEMLSWYYSTKKISPCIVSPFDILKNKQYILVCMHKCALISSIRTLKGVMSIFQVFLFLVFSMTLMLTVWKVSVAKWNMPLLFCASLRKIKLNLPSILDTLE